jgi:hypothetical protein
MDQTERRPNRMITSEDEAIAGAAQDSLHASPIGLDARGFRIIKAASMNRAPEIGIQFEIGAAPFTAHGFE